MHRASRRPGSEYIPRSFAERARERGSPAEKALRNRSRARAKPAAKPAPSHLFPAFNPRNHVRHRLAIITAEFAKHLPSGIEQNDRRKSFFIDAVLGTKLFILLF